jgi:hypothetical protein
MIERLDADDNRVVDPEKVEIVREVQRLYATGEYSQITLAATLNARAYPTVSGEGKWWPKTVRTAIKMDRRTTRLRHPPP